MEGVMKVLLIVDMLNDFCPGGALPVKEGHEIVPKINDLMASGKFDLVIAACDRHPAGHVGFASRYRGKQPGDFEYRDGVSYTLWPDHCVDGTWGAAFHPDLKTTNIDLVIPKANDRNVEAYSAFSDVTGKISTGLHERIQEIAHDWGVKPGGISLTVTGLALDYCVKETAKSARKLGYRTELVVDAIRAVNIGPRDDIKALRELGNLGVKMTESRNYCHGQSRKVEKEKVREMALSPWG